MGKIRQYHPTSFSGFNDETRVFTSLKELLDIEWVDNFRKLPDGQIDANFHKYSINKYSERKGYEYTLIAEYENGYSWCVVGFVDKNEIIKELPVWCAKYKNKKVK